MESQIQMYVRLYPQCVCDGETCYEWCGACEELPDPELPCIWSVMNSESA